jgi:hypothetical protein
MQRFDFSEVMVMLERIAGQIRPAQDARKVMIAFFSICLAGIAIRAMATGGASPRLLVEEALLALLIIVLFIFTKPLKPSNPQHPLPSHEPPHFVRRIKSRRSADGFR